MLSPAVFDTLAALALLLIALLGAYAPRLLHQWGNKDGKVSGRSLAYVLGNMLSAGVMVSAGFVHLLGAAVQQLNPKAVFPLAAFLCGVGFLLTVVADHAAERLSNRTGWKAVSCHPEGGAPDTLPGSLEDAEAGSRQNDNPVKSGHLGGEAAVPETKEQQAAYGFEQKHSFEVENPQMQNGSSNRTEGGSPAVLSSSQSGLRVIARGTSQRDTEPLFSSGHIDSATGAQISLQRSISVGSAGRSIESRAGSFTAKVPGLKQVSFLTAVLMAGALCFHSILEGMAMGAQASIVDTLHIFIAIFAHKGLAAYALGSSIVDSGASQRRFWTVIAIFSLATPAGIALGRVVASVSESGPAAGLSALASGTFLYVAFMEVIPKEMQNPEHGFLKLGMLCLGFGAMSLLAIWA